MFIISTTTEFQLIQAQQSKLAVIYGIVNTINKKIYVGKSIRINTRLKQHINAYKRNLSVNEHIQRALTKYGLENFEFIILETIIDSNNIDSREQYWINHYNSYDENFGYNKTMGGDGGNLTIETKIKLSLTSPNKKKVYQFDANGNLINEWNSVRDIERNTQFLSSTISKACSNKKTYNKTAYGFYWSYDRNIDSKLVDGMGQPKQKVVQKDTNGNIVNIWESISSAAIKTKSSKASIIRCCKKKQKTCNKFIWEYYE